MHFFDALGRGVNPLHRPRCSSALIGLFQIPYRCQLTLF